MKVHFLAGNHDIGYEVVHARWPNVIFLTVRKKTGLKMKQMTLHLNGQFSKYAMVSSTVSCSFVFRLSADMKRNSERETIGLQWEKWSSLRLMLKA